MHSLKDLPTEVDDRFALAAVPVRETIADSLVSSAAWKLSDLPLGARIGTGSRRRAAQLWSLRKDLKIESIRGNVQTRLAKLDSGEFDAIVLAEAGIVRLEMHDLARSQFERNEMLPAPGQGALGIEVRSEHQEAFQAVAQLDHIPTRAAVTAERGLLAALHGGCLAPIAALAEVDQGKLAMEAVVLAQDGSQRLDESFEVAFDESSWEQAVKTISDHICTAMIDRGAVEMVKSHREQ